MKTYPCDTACAPVKEEKKYYSCEEVKRAPAGSIFKIKSSNDHIIVVRQDTILLYIPSDGILDKAMGLLREGYTYELLPKAKLLMSIKES